MAVPIHANLFAGGFHHLVDGKLDEIECAARCSVADRVAQNDGARPASNGCGIEPFDGFAVRAHGVFRDVHGRQAVLDGERDGFFGGALEVVDGPVLDQAADRTRTEKRRGFDGDAHALRDFHDRPDIALMGARRAIGFDFHTMRGDFARERLGIRHGPGSGARQPNIYGIYPERFHHMQDFDLFFYAGIEYRRILQAVSKRLVIQKNARAGRDRRRRGEVPIVNPFVLRQAGLVYCAGDGLVAQRIALRLLYRIRAIERLAEFAAVNLRSRADERRNFFPIIVVTLQMAVAELALFVFFITSTLLGFARFDFW